MAGDLRRRLRFLQPGEGVDRAHRSGGAARLADFPIRRGACARDQRCRSFGTLVRDSGVADLFRISSISHDAAIQSAEVLRDGDPDCRASWGRRAVPAHRGGGAAGVLLAAVRAGRRGPSAKSYHTRGPPTPATGEEEKGSEGLPTIHWRTNETSVSDPEPCLACSPEFGSQPSASRNTPSHTRGRQSYRSHRTLRRTGLRG